MHTPSDAELVLEGQLLALGVQVMETSKGAFMAFQVCRSMNMA